MKRILILSITILISISSFAQIRIEKRHHKKGWYISTPGHKKSDVKEKGIITETEISSPLVVTLVDTIEPAASAPILISPEIVSVPEEIVVTKSIAKKPCLPKRVTKSIIKEVKAVPAFKVEKPVLHSNKISGHSHKVVSQADPEEFIGGFLEFIWDVIVFCFTLLLIAIVLAIVFGVIALVCVL